MRRKIREILNKEEGFTLVELLAVLAILAIIVAIAIPAVGGIIESSRVDAKNAEIELVKDAARLYEVENGELDTTKGVTVDDLVKEGFLELKAKSKVNGEDSVRRAKAEEKEEKGTYIFESKP